ncbi:hypothetical protein SAMN05428952_10543 [Nitrosomonas sp. Nm132]|nr:hypothetical protein SAMN05428952_10543 [Nitrosomonas sp. Nm132]
MNSQKHSKKLVVRINQAIYSLMYKQAKDIS